jgi:hypothetical protein
MSSKISIREEEERRKLREKERRKLKAKQEEIDKAREAARAAERSSVYKQNPLGPSWSLHYDNIIPENIEGSVSSGNASSGNASSGNASSGNASSKNRGGRKKRRTAKRLFSRSGRKNQRKTMKKQ